MELTDILESAEEEYDRPLAERWGKVVFVACLGFVAALAAEAVYDHFTINKRKKNQPVLTLVENTDS